MYKLMRGDCLELMREIPSGSVDLILCDLPYGTMKGANLDGWNNQTTYWDDVLDTGLLFAEYERILRMNGVAILFSQEPYTSHLRTFKSENFNFLYPLMWRKDHFANALLAKKAPVSYFEDLNVFSKQYDKENLHPLREYFADVMKFTGNTKTELMRKLGQRCDHVFRVNSSQFDLCTRETYDVIINVFHIDRMDGFRSFDELKVVDDKFKASLRRVFNLPEDQKFVSNVLEFKKDYGRFHPTQKPVALLEHLVNVYSDPGDLVIDNCMGSGSTGVACANTGRRFIGIEMDQKYYDIASERIADAFSCAKSD